MKAVSPQQRGWSGPRGMACHGGEHCAQSRLHRDLSVSCWPLHSCRSLSRVTSRRTSVSEQEPVVPSRPVARAGRAGRRRGRPWVRPWIPRAEGLLGGGSGPLPPGPPCQAQGKRCPAVPSGGGIGQPGEQEMHVGGIDFIPHTTLAPLPARGGKCALRETPKPHKETFVGAGGENLWA